jgi:hypothetical protein
MKDKVLARLRALFPGVNLSKTRKEKIADYVVSKITTEDEIDEKLNDYNDFMSFADIAKNDDRQREADNKKAKDEADAKAKADAEQGGNGGEDSKDENVPAWAKGLMTKITSLETQFAGEKGKSTINDFKAAAKAKGIPEKYLDKYATVYTSVENYDQETALAALVTDWTETKQLAVNGEVKEGKVIIGEGAPSGTPAAKAAIAKQMEEAVKGLVETV